MTDDWLWTALKTAERDTFWDCSCPTIRIDGVRMSQQPTLTFEDSASLDEASRDGGARRSPTVTS